MSALTDLQAAVAASKVATEANTQAINDAIAKLGAPVSGVPEADVAAAAADIAAQAAQVQADAARLAAAPVVDAPVSVSDVS